MEVFCFFVKSKRQCLLNGNPGYMSSSIVQSQLEGLKKELSTAKKTGVVRKPVPKGQKPSSAPNSVDTAPIAAESLELSTYKAFMC